MNAEHSIPSSLRKWLILPPVLLGLIVLATVAFNDKPVGQEPQSEIPRALRVITVPKVEFVPRVLGYGTAEPGRVWQAVAEVKGRVVEVHPHLTSGMVVRKGDQLLKIDPLEYELAVARLKAEIEQTKAKLLELGTHEASYRKTLKIEKDSLALAEKGLERQRNLLRQKAAAAALVESTEREVLIQRRNVQEQQVAHDLIPVQRNELDAVLAVKNANLNTAQLDLDNTVINAPFDCRLGTVDIEQGQFLHVGQVLFEAHGTDRTEIEVQIPVEKVSVLLDFHEADRARFIAAVVAMDVEAIRKMLQIDATVRLKSGQLSASWKGRSESTRESVDPQTRTLGVVIVVDKPYQQVIPGERPPLIKGMFCEVEMRGKPQADRIVIPRMAVHEGFVYLVDKENRLQRRKVAIAFGQASLVVVKSGLQGGEMLIVSDPTPAIEGMLVKPEPDPASLKALIEVASGSGALQ